MHRLTARYMGGVIPSLASLWAALGIRPPISLGVSSADEKTPAGYIIDFEGEPRRSLDQRRLKAPAARDVAGLIRSIDYSATAAFERGVGPDEHGRIAAGLEDWRAHSVARFVSAYRETLGEQQLWSTDPAAADRLLDFFLLEKAFYEIEYELSHRPDWLRVPLAGGENAVTARRADM